MRRFILPLVLTIPLPLTGCGPSANTLAGKPWSKRPKGTSERDTENPLRKKPSVELALDDRGENSDKPLSQAERDPFEKFDAETLRMIDQELAKTPPEEQKQFTEDIASMPPAMVRQIIQARRIGRQIGQGAPSQFVTPEQMAGPRAGEIQLVAGEERAPGNSPGPYPAVRNGIGPAPANDPGLGTADPWNRQPVRSDIPPAYPQDAGQSVPYQQLPASHSAGHTTGYGPEITAKNPNGLQARPGIHHAPRSPVQLQPPPGGASVPVNNSPGQVPTITPNSPAYQNARVPNEYSPQHPPVPNYVQNGSDPFGGNRLPPIQTASSNPDQKLPGVGNSLGLQNSFGPPNPPNSNPDFNAPSSDLPNGWKQDLGRVIANLEQEIQAVRYSEQTSPDQKQAYVQKHVYLRMLYLMAGQEARAVTAIPEIPAPDQEFWQQTFWAMSNYFDTKTMPESDYRATQTIAQLRTAIQNLQENARLELRNVAFCHKISSFGNFERFTRDEFGPGQPVLVYAEVANFKSTPSTLPNKPNETAYRTQLKSSIEIHRLGPAGELVERFEFEPTVDYCHNHRRDYFHSYEFTIPQRIASGPYVMTLTVEDQLSRKIATYPLNFTAVR